MVLSFVFYLLISCIFPSLRQQESFGRKRAEQWWPVRLQGHSKFLQKRWESANRGKIIAARGSDRFAG